MQRNNTIVAFILLIWFVISFVSNIIGPLMPSLIETYELNLTLAAFLPFSFFLAYAIVSIPSGLMIELIGSKKAMLIAFSLNLTGVLLFALFPVYLIALLSLFIVGIGMAMLQVIINPLMRSTGGEENFAFFSVMGQLVFGLGSFVSPLVFGYLMVTLPEATSDNASLFVQLLNFVTPQDKHWLALYWLFSVVFIALISLVARINIPNIKLKSNEKSGGWGVCKELLKNRSVVLYFIGIVAYVGTEQGLANFMSEFLRQYHGISPEKEGAVIVSWFWGLMSIGCLLGLALLKLMDSTRVLKLFSLNALICVACALYGPTDVALIAFPLTGLKGDICRAI